MKRLVPIALAAALCAALLPGGATAKQARSAKTKTVKVGDNWFGQPTPRVPVVRVRRKTVVKWTWTGQKPHNVTVLKGPRKFKSKTMTSGSYRKRLRRKGTYTIYCTIHGQYDHSMKLVVKRPSS